MFNTYKVRLFDSTEEVLEYIADYRNEGLHIVAARNHGKSRFIGDQLIPYDFSKECPIISLDPGHISDYALWRLVDTYGPDCLENVRYINMAGQDDKVVPFPLFYRFGDERSFEIAGRFIELIRRIAPALQNAPVTGLNPLIRIARNAGAILWRLGYQITEMESLLTNPKAWTSRLERALTLDPPLAPAVQFFIGRGPTAYHPSKADSLLNQLSIFSYDPIARAIFGASVPGIDWREVVEKKLLVLLDFREIRDEELRRFLMLHVFRSLIHYMEFRGLNTVAPVSIIMDEFSTMMPVLSGDAERLWTNDLNILVQKTMRHTNMFLTLAHQSVSRAQFPEAIQDLLLDMGTHMIGRIDDINAAQKLSEQFFAAYPWIMKGFDQYTPLSEQFYENAQMYQRLENFEFILKSPKGKNTVVGKNKDGTPYIARSSGRELSYGFTLPETNQLDPAWVASMRAKLHAKIARPVDDVLAEIESRVAAPNAPMRSPKTGAWITEED